MIIECGNCGTKFRVSESQIGEDGRMVSCCVCKYEWLYFIEERVKEQTNVVEEEIKKKDFIKEKLDAEKEEILKEDIFEEKMFEDFPLENKSRPKFNKLGFFTFFLVVLVFTSTVLYIKRHTLVGKHYYLESFYKIFDYHDVSGLEVIVKEPQKEGVALIKGNRYKIPVSIINTTSKVKHLQLLRVFGYNAKGKKIMDMTTVIREDVSAKSGIDIEVKSNMLSEAIKSVEVIIGNKFDVGKIE